MSEESSSHNSSDFHDDTMASCIRNVANFSAVKSFHLMEKGDFDPEIFKLYMDKAGPKLSKLFAQIKALDEKDMAEEGKLYKHMIFTDVKSSTYGAKLLASAFAVQEYHPAFHVQGPGFSLESDDKLLESKNNNYAVLMSKSFYDRSMNVRFKKAVLSTFNKRPENVQGELIRFIILDQGFKEGIDLYDVKYVHLFEPLLVKADEKQAIGRGTRFCGQQGLVFNPKYGWPLYVYKYNVDIPEHLYLRFRYAKNMFELYLQFANIDLRKVVFAAELENVASEAAVDYSLTYPVHRFSIEKPPGRLEGGAELRKRVPKPPQEIMNYTKMQNYIETYFKQFKYPDVKLENKCTQGGGTCGCSVCQEGGAPQIVQFTPTQDFVRHYFQPASAYKGILFWHTVGVGKTCSAIATATTSFEKEGYTILWVTRHTLKSDIWKNMYQQVCSVVIQEELKKNKLKLPEKIGSPMNYVSKQWMEPISYKQFSNLLLKKNKYYEQIVERNNKQDPLRKTLLIIDEAHKLYSPTVQASEKPDTDILEEMIYNSYKKSGKDSVRVILMTGTPYTEDAMEMIKLVNLLRDPSDLLPTKFNAFEQEYLDEQGYFTNQGKKRLLNKLSGYISYVNRTQDARNFAYPVIENITVPLTEHPETEEENKLKKKREKVKELKEKIKDEKKGSKNKVKKCKTEQKENLKKTKQELTLNKLTRLERCKSLPLKERKTCKDGAKEDFDKEMERKTQFFNQSFEDCMSKVSSLEAIEEYNNELATLQEELHQSRDTKKSINSEVKDLRETMKEEKTKLKEMNEEYKEQNKVARRITDKAAKKRETKRLRETLGKEIKEQKKLVTNLRNKIVGFLLNKKKYMLQEGSKYLEDVSQLTALNNKCKVL
jgi:hypothetical protein